MERSRWAEMASDSDEEAEGGHPASKVPAVERKEDTHPTSNAQREQKVEKPRESESQEDLVTKISSLPERDVYFLEALSLPPNVTIAELASALETSVDDFEERGDYCLLQFSSIEKMFTAVSAYSKVIRGQPFTLSWSLIRRSAQ